jgi:hypothetical protein
VCVAIIAFAIASHADEPDQPEGELVLTRFYRKPVHDIKRFKLGASLKLTNYTYFYDVPQNDIRTSNRFVFKPYFDARFVKPVRLYAEMKLRTDLPQSTVRTRVIPYEAFLSVNADPVTFIGGYQIFTWGVADFVSPTDVLNPRDYTDIFDFEKEGILALKIVYTREQFAFEGIWMPVPDESELPYRDSRFVQPFLTTIDNPLFPVVGLPPANYDATENYLDPDISIKNSQFGARILATVWRFDLGFSYFNGFKKVPVSEIIVGTPDPATGIIPATINQIFLREHIVGFNIAAGVKGVNLKGETALVIPYKSTHDVGSADSLYFTYVLGVDYTFYDIVRKHDFSINVEFLHRINSETPRNDDFANLFQKSIFGKLAYRFSDHLGIEFTGNYNFDNRSYYLQPEVMWGPIDDLVLKLGGNILGGPSDTVFGLFDNQDRVYASAKFYL